MQETHSREPKLTGDNDGGEIALSALGLTDTATRRNVFDPCEKFRSICFTSAEILQISYS